MTHSFDPGSLPSALRKAVAGYHPTSDTLGRSSAGVFRLDADGRPTVYLKAEIAGPVSEIAGEAARLAWLERQGLPCARVLHHEEDGAQVWLLTRALAGADLVSNSGLAPVLRVSILAEALRNLHALDIAGCPFDHRLDRRIATARARTAAGHVDEGDFDDERMGKTASELVTELEMLRPAVEDLVVTHGDACLPNFAADDDGFTGYLDCGRLGVADRYQDIALACWSISYNFGSELVHPFLGLYGISEPDRGKMAYYRLLDEFF